MRGSRHKEVVENDNPWYIPQKAKHMLMKSRNAQLIQYSVVFVRMFSEPFDRADGEGSFDIRVAYLFLHDHYLNLIIST